jgi:hypothetical protein
MGIPVKYNKTTHKKESTKICFSQRSIHPILFYATLEYTIIRYEETWIWLTSSVNTDYWLKTAISHCTDYFAIVQQLKCHSKHMHLLASQSKLNLQTNHFKQLELHLAMRILIVARLKNN